MVEIEFSYTWGISDPTLPALVEAFSQQTGVKVNLRTLEWSTAWADLFTMASQGEGSDVSNIGSTWVSTLANLDALRPFKVDEIAQMGGSQSFVEPSWQSTKLIGDPRVWAVPSLGWAFVIFYRKDLLQSIGLDPETAFQSPQAVQDTILALKNSSLDIPWLNPDAVHPYVDLLHTAASWVWAADGEFINQAGSKVLFDSPQAILGLTHWLDTYRNADQEEYKFLDLIEARDLVATGRVAAAVMNIHMANSILNGRDIRIKRENIGFANLTHTPWVGGGSFVIWDHIQAYPERELAAVELVKFLSTKQAHLRLMREVDLLPLRMDAIKESYPPENPLHEAVLQAATHGRSYYNVSHWRRIESQLCFELQSVLQHIRDNPAIDSATILRSRLVPLAKKLNAMLER